MFPNALQIEALLLRQLDNATLLSYMHMVHNHGQGDATMQTKMGQWWTAFDAAYIYYDQVINPGRKSLETEDLKIRDNERDDSLGAYHEALLGLQRHPVDAKRQAARLLLLNYDTFKPARGQEYMKETELIDQMTKEIDDSQELTAAVTLLALSDYLDDLKQKNQAFATLMASRTAATEGQVKGAVAEARADLEAKYQLFRKLLNVASIYEGDTDYRPFILSVNAEIEHYRQILARKGVSTGSGSSGSGSGGGTASPDPSQGGGNEGSGTGNSGESGNTGDTPGGDTPGTGGDSGGGDDNGDDNNGPIGDAE